MSLETNSERKIEPGDCVFFRECRDTTGKEPITVKTKGYFFGIMIGIVPPFAKDPPGHYLVRAMGDLGYITFDDVAEFLGEAHAKAIMEKFSVKYSGTREERARFIKEAKRMMKESAAGESDDALVNASLDLAHQIRKESPAQLLDAHGGALVKEADDDSI